MRPLTLSSWANQCHFLARSVNLKPWNHRGLVSYKYKVLTRNYSSENPKSQNKARNWKTKMKDFWKYKWGIKACVPSSYKKEGIFKNLFLKNTHTHTKYKTESYLKVRGKEGKGSKPCMLAVIRTTLCYSPLVFIALLIDILVWVYKNIVHQHSAYWFTGREGYIIWERGMGNRETFHFIFLNVSFFFFLNNFYNQRGTQTLNPKLKSPIL